MKKLIALSTAVLLSSCAMVPQNQGTLGRKPQSVYEFIDYIPLLNERVRSREFLSVESCVPFIKKYTDYVYEKPSDFYFPKSETEKEYFVEKGEESLKGLFQLRMGLREFIKDNQSEVTRECVDAVRNAIRYTRFAEDSLAEWLYANSEKPSKVPAELFTGGLPHTILNPKFEKIDYRPGDLLLMRGQSFVSAMIARIGDGDAQFSHLGIIGQDAKGKLYVVEALIETGMIYTPLDEFLKKEEARIVLLRQEDAELGKKAARKVFDYVYNVRSKGKVVPYDFGMIDDEHSEMFCSEVIRFAYKEASNGEYQVPAFRTSFSRLIDSDFMSGMGIKARETFAPADIDLDPRFEVIAEFRTIPKLRKIRMQDSVLTSVFHWIEKEKYEFKFNLSTKVKANGAWIARQLGFAKEKMQKHMKPSTIETILKFQMLTKPLEENLFKLENDFYTEHGHSLTFKDLLRANEEFRLNDCEAYQVNQKSMNEEGYVPVKVKFHQDFRAPRKEGCQ